MKNDEDTTANDLLIDNPNLVSILIAHYKNASKHEQERFLNILSNEIADRNDDESQIFNQGDNYEK